MSFINKKTLAGILAIFLFLILILPSVGLAIDYTPLIQCGTIAHPDSCKFSDFIGTINRIINWIISMAGVIFTVSFIYGGFLYVTSAGDTGKQGKAKDVLRSTLKGFVIILVSWLIVYTILHTLAPQNSSILQFIK